MVNGEEERKGQGRGKTRKEGRKGKKESKEGKKKKGRKARKERKKENIYELFKLLKASNIILWLCTNILKKMAPRGHICDK